MRIFILINFCLFFAFYSTLINGQSLVGKYTYKDKNSSGEITIKELNKSRNKRNLGFKIEVGRNGGNNIFGFCVGEISGVAKEIESNIYEFNSDLKDEETDEAISCRLTFSFSNNFLIVRESDCGYFHGAACNFEGKFIRYKKTIKRESK